MHPLIKISDLSIQYPGRASDAALRHVNLEILPGTSCGLVGESGSGKTTLALALMGMLPPACKWQGEIQINGSTVDLYHRAGSRSARDQVAMVFQNPQTALNPVITVGKQITRVIQRQGLQRSKNQQLKFSELLAQVELTESVAGQYPHQLSGGLQQRVLLAMALARQAKLLIADEPTTALDATTRLQILDLLVRLEEQQGLAVLLISHDLTTIARICQQVQVLYQGRVVEDAPCKLIFDQPRHPYSAGLLAATPKVHRQRPRLMLTLQGEPDTREVENGCAFANRCPSVDDYCRHHYPPLNHDTDPRQRFACFNPRPSRQLS